MTDTITLPRSVVEQAIEALAAGVKISPNSVLHDRFRAALEQPQDHQIGALDMVPAGWKLVPSTLTDTQRQAALDAWWNACDGKMYWEKVYAAMLAAAPQPPVVGQPQVEQGPVAWIRGLPEEATHIAITKGKIRSGGQIDVSVRAFKYDDGVLMVYVTDNDNEYPGWCKAVDVFYHLNFPIVPLYTHPQNLSCKSTQARLATLWGYERPQPPRQPLSEYAVRKHLEIAKSHEQTWLMFARAIERAHGIGGEA